MKNLRMRRPYWIPHDAPADDFPPISGALEDPNGLLAIGGDLSPQRLIAAYSRGIFPWYNDDQPILWWSPHPRMVLVPECLKVSRSLRKNLRNSGFSVTFNQAFDQVMGHCAHAPRPDQDGTWISHDMRDAYGRLHRLGYAHSAECWYEGELVGGAYGIALDQVFFGESMFARRPNASKVAFVHLVTRLRAWDFQLIDCQVYTSHLESLGAVMIGRGRFSTLLEQWCRGPYQPRQWPVTSPAVF